MLFSQSNPFIVTSPVPVYQAIGIDMMNFGGRSKTCHSPLHVGARSLGYNGNVRKQGMVKRKVQTTKPKPR